MVFLLQNIPWDILYVVQIFISRRYLSIHRGIVRNRTFSSYCSTWNNKQNIRLVVVNLRHKISSCASSSLLDIVTITVSFSCVCHVTRRIAFSCVYRKIVLKRLEHCRIATSSTQITYRHVTRHVSFCYVCDYRAVVFLRIHHT